jgi:DNA-binding NtrC family response regulator
MKPTLAIIDDETLIRQVLRHHFERRGYRVLEASTASQGIHLVREEDPDVILLDLKLPDMDGLSTLDQIKTSQPESAVIVLTAYGTYEKAVEAVKRGAEDFLIKEPAEGNLAAMELTVSKAVDRLRKDRIRSYYSQHFRRRATDKEPSIPGEHPSIRALNGLVDLVAQNPSTTLLITGESGTGKELTAKTVHQKSSRRDKPFVEINCAGLSENLLDSELFGHERGAFTDAKLMKRGLLEVADNGTVLLDEIGDMPLTLQAKLLGVLEDRSFSRIGSTETVHVDVRIVAATHRDLDRHVADGRFREDLLYRLRVVPIVIPPLRERVADIVPLAETFVQRFNREFGRQVERFHPDAAERLKAHDWPGNVRELRNVVERAMLFARGPELKAEDLMLDPGYRPRGSAPVPPPVPVAVGEPYMIPPEGIKLDELEDSLVRQAMERAGGNKSRAAKILGISRDQIRYRLEKMAEK